VTAAATARSSPWLDAVRLSLGTLTALPVPAPRRVDRDVAGRAMLLAPLVGAVVGVAAAAVLFAGRTVYHEPVLPSALAVATLAIVTRGLHLDGLADTADGLGVGAHRGRERALTVMRAGDVGPFGVAAVALVVIIQITALSDAVSHGLGTESIVGAAIVGRLAATHACLAGIPAARPDGLGAAVAGSVPWVGAAVVTALVIAGGLLEGGVVDDDAGTRPALLAALSVVVGLAAGWLVVLVARRRFGGITGDVLGACIEVATTGALLVLAAWPWTHFPG
jgi:adenosylcobinamide-GDP ribazoletransferase